MLIAQPLVELLALFLDLLARRVVGADEQVADDGVLRVAQSRDRHDRRKPAAVFPKIRQLINIFDPSRGLEYQRLEAWRDRRSSFFAECGGARDQLPRI